MHDACSSVYLYLILAASKQSGKNQIHSPVNLNYEFSNFSLGRGKMAMFITKKHSY